MLKNNSRTFLCGLAVGGFLLLAFSYLGDEITAVFNLDNPSEPVLKGVPNTRGEILKESAAKKLSECIYSSFEYSEQFMSYGRNPKHCSQLVKFGGSEKVEPGKYSDGEKMVCQNDEFKLVAGKCIVLSFGISNDWTFDDAIAKSGCKVYSFDPTIGLQDHNRSENVQFFNLGIGGSKIQNQTFLDFTIEFDSYEGILERLKLTDQIIDYLKMDIEGTEIEVFKNILEMSPQLLDNVKQIGLELHPNRVSDTGPPNDSMYRYWDIMNSLECLGFKLFSWERNMKAPNSYMWRNNLESSCYEVVWGKVLQKHSY